MTLTPEQKAEGWIEWNGGDCPIKDDRTVFEALQISGRIGPASMARQFIWEAFSAYRIIEAHGADAEPARPTPATGWLIHKAGRGWYRPSASGYTENVADAGRYSYEDALRRSHPNGMHGPRDGMTIKHESEIEMPEPPRPTPFPADYSELVFDDAGWSQTIIVDGKRPEWLRDDDRITRYLEGEGYAATDRYCRDTQSIRVRRREPKRETRRCHIIPHRDEPFFRQVEATIDLIDGKPDLSTLKIAEDAL